MKELQRCQALNSEGKQCRKRTLIQHQYHGDSEIYGFDEDRVGWVNVYLCIDHAIKVGHEFNS